MKDFKETLRELTQPKTAKKTPPIWLIENNEIICNNAIDRLSLLKKYNTSKTKDEVLNSLIELQKEALKNLKELKCS
jgi:sugar-specific transcriptional regulator TrmB